MGFFGVYFFNGDSCFLWPLLCASQNDGAVWHQGVPINHNCGKGCADRRACYPALC